MRATDSDSDSDSDTERAGCGCGLDSSAFVHIRSVTILYDDYICVKCYSYTRSYDQTLITFI